MFSKSTLLHLRIPFSYFLLPVFLFATAVSPNVVEVRLRWVFFILHFMIYPASNGYNSYFDKDEKSIGGLKNPPPVSRGLYFTSLLLEAGGIALAMMKCSLLFGILLIVYGLASKAYSHPSIRLKKYAFAGWLVAGFFQGAFTFIMAYLGVNGYGLAQAWQFKVLVPAGLCSLMLWANYPMTQVYQHEEDEKHGDLTLSRKLGIAGTFYFAALFFGLTTVAFILYFRSFLESSYAVWFLTAMTPVVIYFSIWFLRVWRDRSEANFGWTMGLNFISSTSLNAFFVWLFLEVGHYGQYFFN